MKIIAFHLPQFHRIPENDKWWGEGFTEWTNTKKTKPLFPGHYQPREPFNDNYYDLTNPVARKKQADLAKKYGIFGFCYYHYWFNGYQLLQTPVNEILRLKEPDFPFCMCWANEPWTRAWKGKVNQILMPQKYGTQKNWEHHFKYLIKFFLDKRYIKIDDKPLFVIYRSASIRQCDKMLDYWNTLAKEYNLEGIFFAQMLTSYDLDLRNLKEINAQIEFEPNYTLYHKMPSLWRLFFKVKYNVRDALLRRNIKSRYLIMKFNYDQVWQNILHRKRDPSKMTFIGGFSDWDNTPRSQYRANIFQHSSPSKFGYYLQRQIQKAKQLNTDYLFLNAWNEWAEGAYLEPDKMYRYAYLSRIKKISKDM